MGTSKKLKERKKKAKERATEKQVLRRREAKRKADKAERLKKAAYAAEETKLKPFRKDDSVRQAIEYNLKILKALEKEQLKTQKQREELNRKLEELGYTSLEDKLEAMKKGGGSFENIPLREDAETENISESSESN